MRLPIAQKPHFFGHADQSAYQIQPREYTSLNVANLIFTAFPKLLLSVEKILYLVKEIRALGIILVLKCVLECL